MNSDVKMLKSLFWNDQAKQRYFNVSRAIVGLSRIKDYERDASMDEATYNSMLTKIQDEMKADTKVNQSVDLSKVISKAVADGIKAAKL